ncbi:hypothetical protein GCM10008935_21480 [Alkalibacillus silvisoli]|uniref:Uncharacterized protein n=1 Tax=Alkalibacillus silvisoli TaxID=392823 RepID=A0ABN1A1S3_9BACI
MNQVTKLTEAFKTQFLNPFSSQITHLPILNKNRLKIPYIHGIIVPYINVLIGGKHETIKFKASIKFRLKCD